MSKPTAVIFDVDGTLCDVTSIRHLILLNHPDNNGKRDFDKFHTRSIDCPPHQYVVDATHKAKADGHVVIVLTARQEKYRQLTKWWLLLNDVSFDHQLHRRTGDGRKDRVVKKEILDGLREHYEIIHCWDDNPNVVGLWESEGIPVTVVPGWMEDSRDAGVKVA